MATCPSTATTLASLPTELRLLILANFTSLIDLRHAIIAIPELNYVYMRNQRVVLTSAMKNAVWATYGTRGNDQLWTRMWIGMVVDYVIEGGMSFEEAMGCIRAVGLAGN